MKRILLGQALAVALFSAVVGTQTRITMPPNKYTPQQDVELGQKAAAEARQQLPVMRDDAVSSYVERLGRRLVDAIPPEFANSAFKYSFETVNVREINAFALPGGPMFVNRGMIEAAKTEGEVAGVMAHEISHVVLRHGTAQASKATKYEIGQLLGAIGGAIIGGQVGSVIAQGTQFGLGAAFMRFGREFEKQADIEGANIMARAGYDPRDMANMFKTIEQEGGASGPEWLSDHPNPGNRSEYITKEAQALKVANPTTDTEAFSRVREHLKTLPKAPTSAEAAKAGKRGGTSSGSSGSSRGGTLSERVEAPSSRYQSYNEGDIFTVSVPSNWRELSGSNAVTFAPEGAYGDHNGGSVFTHGIEIGITRDERARDLEAATDDLIESLSSSNPKISQVSGYRTTSIDGHRALQASLGNISDATGREETIQLVTTQTRDGYLFYAVAVAPREEFSSYQSAFQKVLGSIRIKN